MVRNRSGKTQLSTFEVQLPDCLGHPSSAPNGVISIKTKSHVDCGAVLTKDTLLTSVVRSDSLEGEHICPQIRSESYTGGMNCVRLDMHYQNGNKWLATHSITLRSSMFVENDKAMSVVRPELGEETKNTPTFQGHPSCTLAWEHIAASHGTEILEERVSTARRSRMQTPC